MENLLKFIESKYYFQSEDIHKKGTTCNLHAHG